MIYVLPWITSFRSLVRWFTISFHSWLCHLWILLANHPTRDHMHHYSRQSIYKPIFSSLWCGEDKSSPMCNKEWRKHFTGDLNMDALRLEYNLRTHDDAIKWKKIFAFVSNIMEKWVNIFSWYVHNMSDMTQETMGWKVLRLPRLFHGPQTMTACLLATLWENGWMNFHLQDRSDMTKEITCITSFSSIQFVGNCLFGAKPLPEPTTTICQLDIWEYLSVDFY